MRDDLPTICVGPAKNLKRFVEGKIDFDDAYHNAMDAGGGSIEYKRLHAFRQWLAKADTESDQICRAPRLSFHKCDGGGKQRDGALAGGVDSLTRSLDRGVVGPGQRVHDLALFQTPARRQRTKRL